MGVKGPRSDGQPRVRRSDIPNLTPGSSPLDADPLRCTSEGPYRTAPNAAPGPPTVIAPGSPRIEQPSGASGHARSRAVARSMSPGDLRARVQRDHGREKQHIYPPEFQRFGSASLFIKQGTANVSLFVDGRHCRSTAPPRLTRPVFAGRPACRRRSVVTTEVTGFRRCGMAECTTAASRAPTWPLSVSAEPLVDHRSLAPSPPLGRQGCEVDRGSKGPQGSDRGGDV